ncbi:MULTISPECIES: hypothetical protein [Streptomyces]|uniref:Uncharacterized protein n=1 Tax=Streptomyces ramulosus TaxID=47762 RepID=A0ABW1FQH3_9ACTN
MFAVRRPEALPTGGPEPDAATPADPSGTPGGTAPGAAQLRVFIPVPPDAVPGAQTPATVVFSAPSADPWADHCALLLPFLRSLRFVPRTARDGAPAEPVAGGARG